MSLELVNQLNSQIEQRIHGPGREQVLSQFEQKPTADSVAEIAYEIIVAVDTQAEQRGAALDIDVLMGVATETIDILIEIIEAMGHKINIEEMQEESLIKMIILHMREVEGDPEQVAVAREMLAQMTDDGTVQAALNHIGEKADEDNEQILAKGMQMAQPVQKPVAAGVQQGLMG